MIEFGKIVREITNNDGTVTIQTEGYYDGRKNTVREEIREDIKTDEKNVLKDVITCLERRSKSPQVKLDIKYNKFDKPYLIQKTTIVYKTNNN